MSFKIIFQVLSEVIDWLKCDQLKPVVKVTVAYFLCSLGKKVFAPDNLVSKNCAEQLIVQEFFQNNDNRIWQFLSRPCRDQAE